MGRLSKWIPTILAFVCLSSCSIQQNAHNARSAVDKLHARYNAGQIDRIYEEAAPTYRETLTAEQSRKMFTHMRGELGDFKSWKMTGAMIHTGASGTNARVGSRAVFEKGKATETFIWRINGATIELVEYKVNIPIE